MCTQVADRFHLLQNLIDRMKDIFREELPEKFYIKDGKLLDETPAVEKRLKIPEDSESFHDISYDNSPPLDQAGNPVRFDDTTYHPGRARSKKKLKAGKKTTESHRYPGGMGRLFGKSGPEGICADAFHGSSHPEKASGNVRGRCGKAFRTAYPEQE